jgi:hypothetical protein
LSKCQAGAAADGDLTLAEVKDCYSQVFWLKQYQYPNFFDNKNFNL